MRIELEILEFAQRQAGIVSRLQVLAVGGSDRVIHRALARGGWIQVAEGVYRLAAFADSFKSRLWTVTLGTSTDVVVSHEAAAALHGLATFKRQIISVTVPHSNTRLDGIATVHQSRRLYPEHVVELRGLRVTAVARTAIDLAANYRRPRIELVVDDSLASRKATLLDYCSTFDDVACRGRKGTQLMRRILQVRQPGYIAPQSRAESLLLRVLRLGGLPRPVLQFPHPAPEFDGRHVDAAYVRERILLEADSRRWHTQVAATSRDHDRDYAAKRVGWDTYRFWWDDLTRRPEWVVGQVRSALHLAA